MCVVCVVFRLKAQREFERKVKTVDCSLIECLSHIHKPIELNKDNKYFCEYCDSKQDAIKKDYWLKLPNVLLFHLCRAHWSNDRQEKLRNHVSFPLKSLSLAKFKTNPTRSQTRTQANTHTHTRSRTRTKTNTSARNESISPSPRQRNTNTKKNKNKNIKTQRNLSVSFDFDNSNDIDEEESDSDISIDTRNYSNSNSNSNPNSNSNSRRNSSNSNSNSSGSDNGMSISNGTTSEDIDNIMDSYDYDLVSVLIHHGRSMNQGHYIAYCFHRETERWFKFDDVKVTLSSEAEVLSCEAYLLFYERKNVNKWIKKYLENIRFHYLKRFVTNTTTLSSLCNITRSDTVSDLPFNISMNVNIRNNNNKNNKNSKTNTRNSNKTKNKSKNQSKTNGRRTSNRNRNKTKNKNDTSESEEGVSDSDTQI